ncbi:Pre-B-cell leukemia transcription factor-interacting protein 1 [Ceratobasidium sp. AG-Ba]|nr:Pre-B-cell leukemia transcription factor-interacting protein 1 [Ceratobasidium sp. AG-Ba]
MSDAPVPIFKRTKSRPNRARPPSPEPENDAAQEEEQSPGAMSLMTKMKNKHKQKTRTKLSFEQDEENGSEGMTPKRAESGRKSKLANPAVVRMPESLDQASISRTSSAPVYDKAYLDELKAATQSAPAPTPGTQDVEMTLGIDEADGAVVVDDGMDTGDVFDTRPTEIPMSSAVIEAKKKRERMRLAGQTAPQEDFISLSVTRRDDVDTYQGPHPESRLMREDDDLGEGDDDDAEYTGAQERIALGKKGRKEAERQRKAGMIEMIEDVTMRRLELGSWRKSGEEATTVAQTSSRKSKCTKQLQTPVPTLDPAITRLTQALTKLTTSHAGNTKSLTSLGDERSSLEDQETKLRELVTEAEEKRAWFNGFKEWMDSLADFLDEKFPMVEKIEEDFVSLLTERAEMVPFRLTKPQWKSTISGEHFLAHRPRNLPSVVLAELHAKLAEPNAPAQALIPTRGTRLMDRLVQTMSATLRPRDPRKGVAKWFGKWRSTWGDSYRGAWGSLGVVGAWEMWCRLEICLWDPIVDRRSLDEFRWYSSLHDFSRPVDEAGESTEPTPDDDLVLSMVATAVIPRVAKLIQGGALDPYSAKHVRRLKDVAEQFEATLEADAAKMGPLLSACIVPFRKAVDEAQAQVDPYLAPTQAPPAFDPESVPARARYLLKASKLLTNILAWRKYTGEKYGIGELVERLLGRVMLPVAESGWDVGGQDILRKAIVAVPRECIPQDVISRLG